MQSNSKTLSNGDMQQRRMMNKSLANKGKNRAAKNISKIKRKSTGSPMASDEEMSEDGEGDGNLVDEGHDDAVEEPDANALSGAKGRGKSAARLAGPNAGEGEQQAVAGAEMADDDSEEDDYADVENLSDSDNEDELDVEKREKGFLLSAEKDLISEFSRKEARRDESVMMNDLGDMDINEADGSGGGDLSMYNANAQAGDSFDFDFDVDMNEDPFLGLGSTDNVYTDLWDEAEAALWRMPETTRALREDGPAPANQKRVRFQEVRERSSSVSSSSEDEQEAFPDLFAAQDDPMLKQRLALASERGQNAALSDTESCYDFEDEDEKLAFQVDEDSDSDSESSSSDSDDGGDTTDEETREEAIARMQERKKAAGKSPDSGPSTPMPSKKVVPTSSRSSAASRPSTPKTVKGPKTGTFAIDPTRASMTTDSAGNKIRLMPPSQPSESDRPFWDRAKSAASSRPGSPASASYLTMPSPSADKMPARPFTAQSTLGSMFNGNLDILRNNDVSGLADDLFPHTTHPDPSNIPPFPAPATATEDSDTEPQDINMQDFIDMDSSSSDDNDNDDDSSPSSPTANAADPSPTTPHHHSKASPYAHPPSRPADFSATTLLTHFDAHRTNINAFRLNQTNARHISSLASHPASRASASEYNALQKGRRAAANTPITPARKQRASVDLGLSGGGVRKNVGSPLAARRPRSRGNSLGGVLGGGKGTFG